MIGTILAKGKVYAAFEHLNRHDLQSLISAWDDKASFVYPGTVRASGTIQGKKAIEKWFSDFYIQFPKIHFDVQGICVARPFDFIGSNILAAIWEVDLVNKDGDSTRNCGVTVITIKRGKIVHAQDNIFETGKKFHMMWGEDFK